MNSIETLRYVRGVAKETGMTFKQQNMYINSNQAYMFVNRDTGEVIVSNCTLASAFNLCYNGSIYNYDQTKGNV